MYKLFCDFKVTARTTYEEFLNTKYFINFHDFYIFKYVKFIGYLILKFFKPSV